MKFAHLVQIGAVDPAEIMEVIDWYSVEETDNQIAQSKEVGEQLIKHLGEQAD
jgi:hypothetical protein